MRVTLADKGYLVAHSRLRMCPPAIDLTVLGERLTTVRRRYAQAIDLPRLSMSEFANMLGTSPTLYEAAEREGRENPPWTFWLRYAARHGLVSIGF